MDCCEGILLLILIVCIAIYLYIRLSETNKDVEVGGIFGSHEDKYSGDSLSGSIVGGFASFFGGAKAAAKKAVKKVKEVKEETPKGLVKKMPKETSKPITVKARPVNPNELTQKDAGLTKEGLEKLIKEHPDTEKLDVSFNKTLTELPENIVDLKKLKILNLNHCGLKSLPESISELSSLENLHLSGNELSSLPAGLGKLKNLKKITLVRGNTELKQLPKELIESSSIESVIIDEHKKAVGLDKGFKEGVVVVVDTSARDAANASNTSNATKSSNESKTGSYEDYDDYHYWF